MRLQKKVRRKKKEIKTPNWTPNDEKHQKKHAQWEIEFDEDIAWFLVWLNSPIDHDIEGLAHRYQRPWGCYANFSLPEKLDAK